eukprot:363811-Chlamydomonas_euryale.AAC.16
MFPDIACKRSPPTSATDALVAMSMSAAGTPTKRSRTQPPAIRDRWPARCSLQGKGTKPPAIRDRWSARCTLQGGEGGATTASSLQDLEQVLDLCPSRHPAQHPTHAQCTTRVCTEQELQQLAPRTLVSALLPPQGKTRRAATADREAVAMHAVQVFCEQNSSMGADPSGWSCACTLLPQAEPGHGCLHALHDCEFGLIARTLASASHAPRAHVCSSHPCSRTLSLPPAAPAKCRRCVTAL